MGRPRTVVEAVLRHPDASSDIANDDCGPVYEVPVVREALAVTEEFAVGTVTHLPEGGGAPVVERAVLAVPGQVVELLPGWEALAS